MKISELFDLTGKIAIVTGAGDGIGRASAMRLAEAGADVVCCDININKANETAKEILEYGRKCITVKCDVTLEKDLKNLVNETIKYYGTVNILLNNAGGGGKNEFFDKLTSKYIRSIYNLNVFSKFTLMKLCAPHMKKSGYGSIINISSLASIISQPNMSVYGSSRAAINQLTKYASMDLAPKIRVNTIGPGAIKTNMLASVISEEIEKKLAENIPLKRLGKPDDIAMGVLYLASPASSWVDGQTLFIDGGER